MSPPKIRFASLNASTAVAPAPAVSGFAARHALRCSSDRKKLSVVQSDVHTRRSPSPRLPTQTMTSPAPTGPVASAARSSGSPQ